MDVTKHGWQPLAMRLARGIALLVALVALALLAAYWPYRGNHSSAPAPVTTVAGPAVSRVLAGGAFGPVVVDGGRIYVLNVQADYELSVLEGQHGALLQQYVSRETPYSLGVDGTHERVFVGDAGGIHVISLPGWKVLMTLGSRPCFNSLTVYDPIHQRLLVCTWSDLKRTHLVTATIDVRSGRTVATIPNAWNSSPHQVEVAPQASRFIYSILGDDVTVLMLVDTASGRVVKKLELPGASLSFAVDQQAGILAVPVSDDNTLDIISLRDGAVLKSVPVGTGPQAASIDGALGRIYVANAADGTLSILDERTGARLRTVTIPAGADNTAASSTTGQVYVAGGGTDDFGNLTQYSTITVVNGRTGAIAREYTGTEGQPTRLLVVPQSGSLVLVDSWTYIIGLVDTSTAGG